MFQEHYSTKQYFDIKTCSLKQLHTLLMENLIFLKETLINSFESL